MLDLSRLSDRIGFHEPMDFLTHKQAILAANRDRIERFLKEALQAWR